MRVGIGFDVHRFESGRPLYLGGVCIPFPCGLIGHSDADVLLHAICDAMLGSIAAGDIGVLFPDSDERWLNVRSTKLLESTRDHLLRRGFRVTYVDTIIVAEKPRIVQYASEMKSSIASILQIPKDQVSIKATTGEGLGLFGSAEGIAAWASVTTEPV